MEIIFILYRPGVPGNVGAAARAMKTMGFSKLRLIEPCDYLSEEARMFAHASSEILEKAKVYGNFTNAVKDIDFIIGTSSRKRSPKEDYPYASELRDILDNKEDHLINTGIVFGTEESGLPNEILMKCDIASTIAIKEPYPSLNLAQALMLYAYELSEIKNPETLKKSISPGSFHTLKDRVASVMRIVGIPETMPIYSRILERISFMNSADLNMLHSVSARIMKYIKYPKNK